MPVKLNGIELVQVTVTKFLGVQIDDKFSCVNQICAVKRKLSSAIGSLYRIKDKVDENTLLTIYNTLILPHLSYCCEIWGKTYNCRINKIVMLQKRAIRIIDKAGYREHSSRIFRKFNVLKFPDLIDFNTCILMYKAANNMLPINVQTELCKNKDIHKYRTRNKDKFHVRSVNTHLKQMSIHSTGVKLWNSLEKKKKSEIVFHCIFSKKG